MGNARKARLLQTEGHGCPRETLQAEPHLRKTLTDGPNDAFRLGYLVDTL